MSKLIRILGGVLFILFTALMCAQAFSLFPFQLGFMKGSKAISYQDLIVSAAFSPLSSYTFANTTTGKNRVSFFRVTNGGNDTLQNYTTSASGTSFSKYSSPSGNINAGSYADVKFRFAPATAGAFDGAILWTAPNMTSKTFHLHGTGLCLAPSQTTGVSAGSETSSGFTVTFTAGANSTSSSLEYGTTTSYGTTINPATSPQAITGLSASTLYHYRINAINSCSTTNGADGTATTAAGASYLFDEAFSGSTLCYTGFASVCNQSWLYAQSATFAAGTLTETGQTEYAQISFTPSDTVYAAVRVNWSSGTAEPAIITIMDGSNNVLCDSSIYQSSQFGTKNTGGTQQYTSQAFTTGTDYDIKLMAVKGTGANAQCRIAWSAAGANSWTWGTLSNDGTWTAQPARAMLKQNALSCTSVYKRVRVGTSDLGL